MVYDILSDRHSKPQTTSSLLSPISKMIYFSYVVFPNSESADVPGSHIPVFEEVYTFYPEFENFWKFIDPTLQIQIKVLNTKYFSIQNGDWKNK